MKLKINNKIYEVKEPTLRQNNAFTAVCMEYGLAFENVTKEFDFTAFLRANAEHDILARMVQTMITPEHSVWNVKEIPLDDCLEVTESQLETIFTVFFAKKKAWMQFFIEGMENLALKFLQQTLK
jgi:hypothetical protein